MQSFTRYAASFAPHLPLSRFQGGCHSHILSAQRKLISGSGRGDILVVRSIVTVERKPTLSASSRFPFEDKFTVKGQELCADQVLELLEPFVTSERMQRIAQVVAQRTFNLLPIVEGLYDMGNLAAVCRSAEALGCGAVHCVTSNEKYKQSTRNSAGAEKWLDVKLWRSTGECLSAAKANGFHIVVTHLRGDSVSIEDIDWTRPTAVVFGNEREGVSDEAVSLADTCAVVPMSGFVDSFNVSVASALLLYHARQQRTVALGEHGDLTPHERKILQAVFMLRHKGRTKLYVNELLKRPPRAWQAHKFK